MLALRSPVAAFICIWLSCLSPAISLRFSLVAIYALSSGVVAVSPSTDQNPRCNPNSMPSKKPIIIFCHGSGDTGPGVAQWIQSLIPSQQIYDKFQWEFPSATPIPYQLSGGVVSSVWYDRMGGFEPTYPELTASVEQSTEQLMKLINDLLSQKKKEGLDFSASQITIGGFSMGGAIALQTATRWHHLHPENPLGGVFGLSCYLNDDSKVWELLQETAASSSSQSSKSWPSTFMAHGASDGFILPKWGESTWDRMQRTGVNGSFKLIPHTEHELTQEVIADVLEFIASNSKMLKHEESEGKSCKATNQTKA